MFYKNFNKIFNIDCEFLESLGSLELLVYLNLLYGDDDDDAYDDVVGQSEYRY